MIVLVCGIFFLVVYLGIVFRVFTYRTWVETDGKVFRCREGTWMFRIIPLCKNTHPDIHFSSLNGALDAVNKIRAARMQLEKTKKRKWSVYPNTERWG